ncbi:MAG: T9SS type A sorting domain-containing protein [Marinilabiliaceae bacterium]|nr:T9SS type A sorting domain-containing protein [Marinilabiliaceae bacterium]
MKQFFLFIVLLASFPVYSQDISSGLILYYSCDTVLSTTIADDSGNNNTGTLVGSANVSDGYSNDGILCLGKNDYVNAPDNITVGLTSFTFATWVKLSSLKDATRFFDWGNGADGTNNFLAFIPSYGSDNGYMVMRYRPASGNAYNVSSTVKCPVGEWAHVAVTFSWNGSSGLAKIYLNGDIVGSASDLPYNPAVSLGNTADNYFGFSRWSQDTNGFNGTFDEIRVYNRALSSVDVMELTGLAELYKQYDLLTLGDLSGVTQNISLPVEMGTNGITVSWESSFISIIDTMGNVIRPDYFDYDVTLTATLTNGLTSMTKVFDATVLAADGTSFTSDLLVCYDFSSVNGTQVYDIAEKQFEGSLKGLSSVITIGTDETGIYNVLKLPLNNSYFDMGFEVGKVVSRLTDYTMSAYFRVDNNYTGLGSNGNFLWNFSNSSNAMTDQNGYIICSLKNQSVSISSGYYTSASGNQSVGFNRQALKSNWHHIAFTQQGNTATIYIDGSPIVSKVITNIPSTSLTKDGVLGTLYNWIGRSCYSTDVYLRNTLVYDFRIYKKALSKAEIQHLELGVFDRLIALESAYNAYVGTDKTAETNVLETEIKPIPSYLEVLQTNNNIVKVGLTNFEKMIVSNDVTTITTQTELLNPLANNNITKMYFSGNISGVNDKDLINQFSFFPNPATDYIIIGGSENKKLLSVFSLDGKLVWQKEAVNSGDKVDLCQLKKGMYVVKFGHQVAKFIKE